MKSRNIPKKEITNEDLTEKLEIFANRIETTLIQKIETSINDIAEMTARGFDSMGQKLDSLENKVDRVENRLDSVENTLTKVEKRLDRVEDRLGSIDAHVITTENNHNLRISTLEDQMKVVYPH
ncbi:MAG: hypothetical protein ABIO57_04080 [Candidatus Paceibacterota bacterium]